MKRSPWKTISIIGINYAIFAATVLIKELAIDLPIHNYWQFILAGCILVLIYGLIVFGLNLLVNRNLLSIFKTLRKKHA